MVVSILLVVVGLSVSAGLLRMRIDGFVASVDLTVICRRLFLDKALSECWCSAASLSRLNALLI